MAQPYAQVFSTLLCKDTVWWFTISGAVEVIEVVVINMNDKVLQKDVELKTRAPEVRG
jgi:hypothetical protein